MLILTDFNHCRLYKSMPGFHNYVNCSTKNNNTSNGHNKDAYTARAKPLSSTQTIMSSICCPLIDHFLTQAS